MSVKEIETFAENALKNIEASIKAFNDQDLKKLNYQTVVKAWQAMIDPFVFKQAFLMFLPMVTDNKELIEKAEMTIPSLHEKLAEICSDEKTINIVLTYGEQVAAKSPLTDSQIYILGELVKSIEGERAANLYKELSSHKMMPFTYVKGIDSKTSQEKISILNWNICCFDEGLSMLFGGIIPWEERIVKIGDAIKKSGADIVCLQEVFSEKAGNRLMEQLKDTYGHFYINIGPRINGFNLMKMGISSGLFVASKNSLENPLFQPYGHEETPSTRAYGFFMANLNSNTLFATTQLQPGTTPEDIKFRHAQLQAIQKQINDKTLLLGDLNIERDSDEYKKGLAPHFDNSYTGKDWTSCDLKDYWWKAKRNMDAFKKMLVFEWIDYFLSPKNSSIKSIRTSLITVNDPQKPQEALSDHQAMITNFEL